MNTISTPPGKVNRLYTATWKYLKALERRDFWKLKSKRLSQRNDALAEKLAVATQIIATLEGMNFCSTQPAGVFGKLKDLKAKL